MPVATEFADHSCPPLLDGLPDSDLLEAWQRDRHPASLATLVDRYAVMVLSVCRRRCRSEQRRNPRHRQSSAAVTLQRMQQARRPYAPGVGVLRSGKRFL